MPQTTNGETMTKTDTQIIEQLAERVAAIATDDDLAPAYAGLIVQAQAWGARTFAFELAQNGMKAGSIGAKAQEWSDWDFEPAAFAGVLSDFASKIRELV
jgi:hypothetical protein